MERVVSFAGTPLIPPYYVALAAVSLFVYLLFLYLLYGKKKISKVLGIGISTVLLVLVEGFILAAYWLLPSPKVLWVSSGSDQIRVVFDRPVSRRSMEKNISPDIAGVWVFEKPIYATHLYREVVFYPDAPLAPAKEYKIYLSNIQNTLKRSPPFSYEFSFKTQTITPEEEAARPKTVIAPTVKLAVPAYLQQHTLSCEVSALRMTLAFKGISVTEEELLAKVGIDNTPHIGNTWGNPYEKFVGNVDGTQMKDGYGVYWGPIARVGAEYRQTASFEGWSIDKLTKEIQAGNPVIIWAYAGSGRPTSWRTPSGQEIYAVRDEHTVVVVGFVGNQSNPTQIIVNDPLIGKVNWSRSLFDKKWKIFNNSGVVVY